MHGLHFLLAALILGVLSVSAQAQQPIIDVHVHSSLPDENGPLPSFACIPMLPQLPAPDPKKAWPDQLVGAMQKPTCDDPVQTPERAEALMLAVIAELEKNNAVGILSGPPERVNLWKSIAPDRFIKSLQLNLLRDPYDAKDAREYFKEGGFLVLGEVSNQYSGIAPNDERMMPFWAVAEEMDIPVQIHMGSGPPGTAALYPDFRIAHGDPMLLEPVLAKHPRLRVSIQHMAEGFNEELFMILWTYPRVYVDIGGVMWTKGTPYFYARLKDLVDAGFANRIMFGADAMTWPGLITKSIEIIKDAPFLTDNQKADILFNNAVRFFGFEDAEMQRRALGASKASGQAAQ